MSGKVWLVGAGPGDPGLITVRGKAALEQAEVVVYDRLAAPELLAHAPASAERIDAGKAPGRQALSQEETNTLLVEQAQAGKRVVRLKGGDPYVFGRGGEEALALVAAGVPFEVVSGVTSAVAVPAAAGIPVTQRGVARSFAVITGHEADDDTASGLNWAALATGPDTLVLLMSVGGLAPICQRLIDLGRDPATPAAVISRGTTSAQRTVTAPLQAIAAVAAEAAIGAPAVTVIGEVAHFHEALAWFERRPLHGLRVLITRATHQADALASALRTAGTEPLVLPTIVQVDRATSGQVAEAATQVRAGRFAWVVFTSVNGVSVFMRLLDAAGLDARVFGSVRLCVIGQSTAAELRRHGLRADLVGSEANVSGVVTALSAAEAQGPVLVARAAGGRAELLDGIRAISVPVEELVLYESVPPADAEPALLNQLRAGAIDALTFASPSAARGLLALVGEAGVAAIRRLPAFCIGPTTGAAARDLGYTVVAEAAEQSADGLVEAITRWRSDTSELASERGPSL